MWAKEMQEDLPVLLGMRRYHGRYQYGMGDCADMARLLLMVVTYGPIDIQAKQGALDSFGGFFPLCACNIGRRLGMRMHGSVSS